MGERSENDKGRKKRTVVSYMELKPMTMYATAAVQFS